MRSKRLKTLAILSCFVILAACATKNEIIEPIPCPLYPVLFELDPELAAATPSAVKVIVVQNYLMLDAYAQRLEVRANCHVR